MAEVISPQCISGISDRQGWLEKFQFGCPDGLVIGGVEFAQWGLSGGTCEDPEDLVGFSCGPDQETVDRNLKFTVVNNCFGRVQCDFFQIFGIRQEEAEEEAKEDETVGEPKSPTGRSRDPSPNLLFGDPCKFQNKWLSVKVSCVSREKTQKSLTDTGVWDSDRNFNWKNFEAGLRAVDLMYDVADFAAAQVNEVFEGLGDDVVVHRGFWSLYLPMRPILMAGLTALGKESVSTIFVGHSLGAALATLAMFDAMWHGFRVHSAYLYGSPRVGNYRFVEEFNRLAADLVPLFPPVTGLGGTKMLHVGASNRFMFEYVKPKAPSIIELALLPFHLWIHKLGAYRDAVRALYCPPASPSSSSPESNSDSRDKRVWQTDEEEDRVIQVSGLRLQSCASHFPEDMPFGEMRLEAAPVGEHLGRLGKMKKAVGGQIVAEKNSGDRQEGRDRAKAAGTKPILLEA
uniref:Fungal lipase-type domain-containing protein n=1 Tax=Chromera velia CCMP2878 TaxID=1169474 RepID=A0A0G4I3R2_9ALVE|eukprot:Cvel_10729.t1-p1 / transcript=Cvel_10729.t1 / gene=Cvel_10729 / organism=Chromera_velia_CCMP2878 / gene_product=Mono- and diacylglycerol lipase, putative / transcript_product=Mono- and diacylglycerol lipase, putative / location=Cvel_scaffold654:3725-7612(+) / protein_length=457 / sequence_SO=supercontig / SO=protein_coding / is_pseudo=false